MGRSMDVDSALRFIMRTRDELVAGCSECNPDDADAGAVLRAGIALYVAGRLVGRTLPVRGWYRCRPCNRRRDGAPASRHLVGAAVDTDLTAAEARTLRAYGRNWPNLMRYVYGRLGIAYTGGVGFKVYPGGGLHLDTRERDWVDI